MDYQGQSPRKKATLFSNFVLESKTVLKPKPRTIRSKKSFFGASLTNSKLKVIFQNGNNPRSIEGNPKTRFCGVMTAQCKAL